MKMDQIVESYFESGRDILLEIGAKTDNARPNVVAFALDRKGRLLAIGFNSYVKTHPYQKRCARKAGDQFKQYLHAEISAIIRARQQVHSLVVVRISKAGDFMLAKPCKVCYLAIQEAGIKNIFYSR